MKPGYVFISNSNKPSDDVNNSMSPITTSNVNRPCLESAISLGYEVFLGVNRKHADRLECDLPVKLYDSHTYRNPFSIIDNSVALIHLFNLIKNNDIKVIHCNTPVGGLVGRICGMICHVDKIIYTAHGFHFYKGGPVFKNWVYKTAERTMALGTDIIITMNQEDYEAAKGFKLRKNGKVYMVHGVGVNTDKFKEAVVNRESFRTEMGFKDDDFLCISMGDLIERKNYSAAIRAIAETNKNNIHYIICGEGPMKQELISLANELGITKQIHFLGFRSDIIELLRISDLFLFTSFQEGLPRSLMEAMASGLPVVASKIRGNVDLINDGINGYLCPPNRVDILAQRIQQLMDSPTLRKSMGEKNILTIQNYDVGCVKNEIDMIYSENIKIVD